MNFLAKYLEFWGISQLSTQEVTHSLSDPAEPKVFKNLWFKPFNEFGPYKVFQVLMDFSLLYFNAFCCQSVNSCLCTSAKLSKGWWNKARREREGEEGVSGCYECWRFRFNWLSVFGAKKFYFLHLYSNGNCALTDIVWTD